MLLRDSRIAKEIRTQLLNTFENSSDDIKLSEIDEEMRLAFNIAKAFSKNDPQQMLIASYDLSSYHKRCITALEQKNGKLESANETLNFQNKALTDEILKWTDRAKINRAVRVFSQITKRYFGAVWNDLYKELLYKYGINLKRRGKSPYLDHIKENEWKYLLQSFSAICESENINIKDLFTRAKIII